MGALGVHRAAFATAERAAPLKEDKVRVTIVTRYMVEMVAEDVDGGAAPGGAHFLPEARPEEVMREVLAVASTVGER